MDKSLFNKIVDKAGNPFTLLDKKIIERMKESLNGDLSERELNPTELKKVAREILGNEDKKDRAKMV